MDYVKWDDKYKIGVKSIDKQHKHFIGIMGKLFEAMQSDNKNAVSKIIDELVAYANTHFATEEELFNKFCFEGSVDHKAEHQDIRNKVEVFLARKDEDPFALGYDLLDLLEDWLFKHIIKTDMKYVDCFKSHGVR